MAVYSYTERYERILDQKYAAESKCDALYRSHPEIQFMNANTIKVPHITISGYKDHKRNTAGFNVGSMANEFKPYVLSFDRDREFSIDPMDIDETNLIVSIANVQRTFEEEQAIPERDAYTFSKIFDDYVTEYDQTPDTTVLTTSNILSKFDDFMADMDDAGVPEDGRILYCTSAVRKLLKEADGISRQIMVGGGNPTNVNRNVHGIDDAQIIVVPRVRFKTLYDFDDGFVPVAHVDAVVADVEHNVEAVEEVIGAKQINMMLLHPSCCVARQKYAYAKVFTPGHDSRTADNYIFQTRKYLDAFLLKHKLDGFKVNVEA